MRYVLHDDAEHAFSEAIGVVMAVTDDAVTILSKKGARIEVDLHDVLAAKLFPL